MQLGALYSGNYKKEKNFMEPTQVESENILNDLSILEKEIASLRQKISDYGDYNGSVLSTSSSYLPIPLTPIDMEAPPCRSPLAIKLLGIIQEISTLGAFVDQLKDRTELRNIPRSFDIRKYSQFIE